jgi:hypothetical protein
MRTLRPVSIVLALSMAAVAGAADFDGSVPLTCKAEKGHDCLPTEATCKILKPETNIDPVYSVDFARKEIRSPFRTALLKVQNTTTNKDSIVLQGTDLTAAWSALIDRKTGALTIALGDAQGAYVVFGQCKVAAAK